MAHPDPLSLFTGLFADINARLISIPRYMDKGDPMVVQWDEGIRKLNSTQPALGALARALWSTIHGDIDVFEMAIADARRAGALQEHILELQTIGYSNLGYASKALSAFQRLIDVRNSNITAGIHVGVACGGFHHIEMAAVQAERAKLDLSPIKSLPNWRIVAAALANQHVSDEVCAKIMDLAGEVMRPRRLFWMDTAPGIIANGIDQPVGVRMRVAVSPDEATLMELELADLVIERGWQHLPFFVTFVGVNR